MHLIVESMRYQIMLLQNPLHEFDPVRHRGFCDESRQLIYISAREPINLRETILRHEAIHAFEFAFGKPADDLESRATWMATVSRSIERQINAQGGWARLATLPADDAEQAAAEPVEELEVEEEPEEPPIEQSEEPERAPGLTPGDLAIMGQWKRRREEVRDTLPRPSKGRRHVPDGQLTADRVAAVPTSDLLGIRVCCVCQAQVHAAQIHSERAKLGPYGMQMRRTLYCDWCKHLQTWLEAATPDGKPGHAPITPEPVYTKGPAMEAFLSRHPEMKGTEF